MSHSFRQQQEANTRKTWFLLAAMFVLLGGLIAALAYYLGVGTAWIVPIAVGISLLGVWTSYWKSDTLVLRMTKARVITAEDAPQLHNVVEEVAIAAGLPMPRVAIVEDDAPNAFATGRDPDHAVIAFTTGLLEVMDREQLQGVTAHEMAHVGNRDTLVMAVAATTAGILAILSDIGLRATILGGRDRRDSITLVIALAAMILAPLAAAMLRAAISRKRESLADATAVAFTRNPTGLRRALEELAQDNTVVKARANAVAHLWIESPLDGRSFTLFSTHPPISERINALRALEGTPPSET